MDATDSDLDSVVVSEHAWGIGGDGVALQQHCAMVGYLCSEVQGAASPPEDAGTSIILCLRKDVATPKLRTYNATATGASRTVGATRKDTDTQLPLAQGTAPSTVSATNSGTDCHNFMCKTLAEGASATSASSTLSMPPAHIAAMSEIEGCEQ